MIENVAVKKRRKIKKTVVKKEVKKDNLTKKAEIDKIFDDFVLQINKLKQERDAVVFAFLDKLKEKQIEEIKRSLKY